MSLYLRERDPKHLDEVIKLADMYLDARIHRDKPVYKKFKDVHNQKTFTGKAPEDKHTQSKLKLTVIRRREFAIYVSNLDTFVRTVI